MLYCSHFAAQARCHSFSCSIGFIIFNFSLPHLLTWALSWSFGWCQEIPLSILSLKGDMRFGCEWQFAFDVCECMLLSVYKRQGRSETTKFVITCWCVSDISICVPMCVCVWKGDWVSVRDSDGAERVWCTVITLSGMWLSWELLALGTWVNKLLFKGQLPSLYCLLFFPTLRCLHPVRLYLFKVAELHFTLRFRSVFCTSSSFYDNTCVHWRQSLTVTLILAPSFQSETIFWFSSFKLNFRFSEGLTKQFGYRFKFQEIV